MKRLVVTVKTKFNNEELFIKGFTVIIIQEYHKQKIINLTLKMQSSRSAWVC